MQMHFRDSIQTTQRRTVQTPGREITDAVLHNLKFGKYLNCRVLVSYTCISHALYSEKKLGVPFNISSYALLTHLVAHVCGLEVGEFIYTLGDFHIYKNHQDQVNELLSREPKTLPRLEIRDEENRLHGLEGLLNFRYEHLNLIGYESHAKIAAPVAV